MRFSTISSMALVVEAVSAAALQPRHYTFPELSGSGQWGAVRTTVNQYSNAGITDVTSPQIRCYTNGDQAAPKTQTVAAGTSVSFKSSPIIFHPGPIQFYMAQVPEGQTAATWDGSGEVWFKIYSEPYTVSGSQLNWASMNKDTISVTIPKSVPTAEYLLKIEHIALHGANQPNGAQFYISCAQIKVTGGGNGTPGPLVAFPGAYKATDPGIKVNIYGSRSYTAPGPPVWTG